MGAEAPGDWLGFGSAHPLTSNANSPGAIVFLKKHALTIDQNAIKVAVLNRVADDDYALTSFVSHATNNRLDDTRLFAAKITAIKTIPAAAARGAVGKMLFVLVCKHFSFLSSNPRHAVNELQQKIEGVSTPPRNLFFSGF
jgi:hypothetical protein